MPPPKAEDNGASPLLADAASVLAFFKRIDKESLRAAVAAKAEELRKLKSELSGLRTMLKSLEWRDGERVSKLCGRKLRKPAETGETAESSEPLRERVYDYLLSCPKGSASAQHIANELSVSLGDVITALQGDHRLSKQGMYWSADDEFPS